jgi:pimeloyl-ACP methyl ester carboxylesterase
MATATVVIVHCAWWGPYLWQTVRRHLQAAGHEVLTPTLTGLSQRSHLVGLGSSDKEIDLDLHIQDILAVLEWEDLQEVRLVGHSYSGMVTTAVADRVPERIVEVIYMDAFVPGDGQCMLDLLPPPARAGFEQQVEILPDGRRVLPPRQFDYLGRRGSGSLSEGEIGRMLGRFQLQPWATFTQPVRLTGAGARVPRTYIHCTDKGGPDALERFAAQARARGDRVHDLSTGHFAMLTAPHELARLLAAEEQLAE